MKVEWRTYAGLAAIVLPIGVVYLVLSREPVGSLLLFACALSLLALTVYLWWIRRGHPDRPEDLADPAEAREADRAEADAHGATAVGDFPSGSVWPLFMGLACLGIAWGLAFTIWITLPSAMLLLTAVVGYAHEVETGGTAPVPVALAQPLSADAESDGSAGSGDDSGRSSSTPD